ncbi:hypothetical protein M569_14577 [Genlisea aurea]|uniref:Uncharacterized protein n=1 Tax=Genlisea aurea TaxID=192259 RepID=S8DBV6_9LAMI|nr:hypothetical protein M569_14577 [Genlisea aurea]
MAMEKEDDGGGRKGGVNSDRINGKRHLEGSKTEKKYLSWRPNPSKSLNNDH